MGLAQARAYCRFQLVDIDPFGIPRDQSWTHKKLIGFSKAIFAVFLSPFESGAIIAFSGVG
jgi:hypothetical protein